MKRFEVHEVRIYRIYDNLKEQWHYSYGYVEEDSKEKALKICAQLNELNQNLKYMQAKQYK